MTTVRPVGYQMPPRGSTSAITQIYKRKTSYTSKVPTTTTSRGVVTQRLPAERYLTPSATASAFGGVNGGTGVTAVSAPPIGGTAGPISIGGIGSSFTHAGVGIMNTFGSIIPLAIRVIIIVIVIKIVYWLIKRRR